MKTNVFTKLICFLLLGLSVTLVSCSKENEDNSASGSYEVNGEKAALKYAYLTKESYNDGEIYKIYLSSHNMNELTKEETADPEIFINDATFAIFSQDGSLPNGTYTYRSNEYTEDSWVGFESTGFYWADAWGDGSVETGDKEDYFYVIGDLETNASLKIKIDSEGNINLETFDTTVFNDEDYDGKNDGAETFDIKISYKGKLTSIGN